MVKRISFSVIVPPLVDNADGYISSMINEELSRNNIIEKNIISINESSYDGIYYISIFFKT